MVFQHPLSPGLKRSYRQLLARQVEVTRADDINVIRPNKETKHAADARIHIKNLVQAVSAVVAISDSDTPAISHRFHQSLCVGCYGLIWLTYRKGSYSCRPQLAQLLASENHCLARTRSKVAVAHPHRVNLSRNVFL